MCCLELRLRLFRGLGLWRAGKVHGSLSRAGKVRAQTPKVEVQEKPKKPKGRAGQRLKFNRYVEEAVPCHYWHVLDHVTARDAGLSTGSSDAVAREEKILLWQALTPVSSCWGSLCVLGGFGCSSASVLVPFFFAFQPLRERGGHIRWPQARAELQAGRVNDRWS